MHYRNLIVAALLVVFSASLCLADTLVITYRSGKTQTVTLDEPSTTINSWQFVGGTAAAVPQSPFVHPEPAKVEAAEQVKKDRPVTEKAPEKKSGVRVNWNAKPIPD